MRARDAMAYAAGALRGHRLRTTLSLTGVAIGVAAVLLLTSLGEGARRYVVGEFLELGSNLLIVTPGRTETTGVASLLTGAPHDLSLEDLDALARVRGIRRAAPLVSGAAPAQYGGRQRDVLVTGTTPELREIRGLRLAMGRFLPSGESGRGSRVCVIGARVRQELFGNLSPLGRVLRVGEERYRVIGVLKTRGVSLGMDLDEIVYIPVDHSMRMFDQRTIHRILVELLSAEETGAAREGIRRALRERHDGEEDFTIFTQEALVETFGRILALLTAALGGIAAISLTVAGIGIMNVMLVSVTERQSEIGLLKAVGAQSRQIVGLFVLEAALLSTAGGAVGSAGALAATRAFSGLVPAFPIAPPPWAWWSAAAVSVLLGVLFGALPARRAARMDPVAALARRR